jgi:cardiolipin synthase A/B
MTGNRAGAILAELQAAVDRGVAVSLILDDTEQSRGALTHDARAAFESLGNRVAFYVWPAEQRPPVGQGLARFHAKAVIADHHVALVTSANLTGAAMSRNIEMGLVVHGGPIPHDLEEHVRELISSGILRRVG